MCPKNAGMRKKPTPGVGCLAVLCSSGLLEVILIYISILREYPPLNKVATPPEVWHTVAPLSLQYMVLSEGLQGGVPPRNRVSDCAHDKAYLVPAH